MPKSHPMSLSALVISLMLATGAGIAAAETADESRLRQLAGQAGSYANEVRALLAKGASPNVPDRDGRTAVHGAARISAVETMRALLDAGGNPNRQDKDGNTPLHLASAAAWVSGFMATIRLLLEADADPGIANGEGRTPLHIAVTVPEEPAAVEALLAHGADANRRDRRGSTPLHAALGPNPGGPGWSGGPGAGTPDIVGPLLARGADPRIVNGDGLTALQLFVREGASGRTAALLLEAGADPDRKFSDGDAPLHAAIRSGGSRGKVEVVKALLAGGADPCVRDAKRYTPYHIAPEGGAIRYDLGRAGGGDLACDGRGEAVALDSEERRRIQEALAGAGFDPGPADGEFGPRTRRAIEGWQQANGHAATGKLTSGQVEALLADAPPKPFGPNWSIVENQPCQVWNSGIPEKLEPFTWSGPCVDGKASGEGHLTASGIGASHQGGMADGKRHGHGTTTYASGNRYEGEYRDGKPHGYGTVTYADGDVVQGQWRTGCFEQDGRRIWIGTSEEACSFK